LREGRRAGSRRIGGAWLDEFGDTRIVRAV
jgi:hypothetical protein